MLMPIKFADECPPCEACGEPWCEEHQMHYADCPCIGPSNAEDYGEIIKLNSGLYVIVK